ncbi:hypothetical protein [Methylomarinovum caldicuralii]|uniref:hypothetical protein n=1 Tax=Methylomarinovum caldicuralii TaxID=438856 RepID=UPI002955593D|nr:hypothetical protein [Methylomarinovum caldicuralii]
MNYWTVFAAPLAWQGVTSLGTWGRWLVVGWWPVGVMVSLAHTVRPQGWLGC